MTTEILEKANEIKKLIEQQEEAIKYLESGFPLYKKHISGFFSSFYEEIVFEDWEIRLILHNKKQRLQALKKELEKL